MVIARATCIHLVADWMPGRTCRHAHNLTQALRVLSVVVMAATVAMTPTLFKVATPHRNVYRTTSSGHTFTERTLNRFDEDRSLTCLFPCLREGAMDA